MSYGKDLRKRVLDFIADGDTKAQAARVYQIHVSTIYIWLKQPADYEQAKTRNCSARKKECEFRFNYGTPKQQLKSLRFCYDICIILLLFYISPLIKHVSNTIMPFVQLCYENAAGKL